MGKIRHLKQIDLTDEDFEDETDLALDVDLDSARDQIDSKLHPYGDQNFIPDEEL